MRVRLSAAMFYRFPEARAERTDSGWVVELGKIHEAVLPLGVDAAPGYARAGRLDVSLHDIHEQLRDVAVVLDDGKAALALAIHCRQYPAPLLCLEHGWPAGHQGECTDKNLPNDGPWLLKVEHVVAMVTGLDGVSSLAFHLRTQRKPPSRALVENALAWPILDPEFVRIMRLELGRDGEWSIMRARQIVTLTMTRALRLSNLELLLEWLPNDRPSLALEAPTAMGAYVIDFVRHVGARTGEDRSVTCVVCGQPYTPRSAPRPGAAYCTALECQRERRRINKARQRARGNAQEGKS